MRSLTAALLATATSSLLAGTVEVQVRDARGAAVRDAVVYAMPEGRPGTSAKKNAVMDQKDRMFIPHVLAIQTGTAVRFPNSDDIQHQVYSFSRPKPFQLPLYSGTPANPVLFDKAGVVALGCYIHDRMSAYIVIVETPYFEKTDERGQAVLREVDAGRYSVHLWYPEMRKQPEPRSIVISGPERRELSFVTAR